MEVFETMTKQRVKNYTVRVWRKSEADQMGPDASVLAKLRRMNFDPPFPTAREIVQAVVALGDISAIEVLDEDGQGRVYYPEWP